MSGVKEMYLVKLCYSNVIGTKDIGEVLASRYFFFNFKLNSPLPGS